VTDGHGVLSSAPRRRGQRKGDLKEEAILATCERLLAEKPLGEIGVDELAAGAGISRPSFYFYFESKNAVLRTLVQRLADRMYAQAATFLARADEEPEVTISRSIAAAADQWREHGPVLRAAVESWGTVPELQAFWEDIIRRFVEQAAARIAEEGGSDPPAESLAKALIWMNERCFYTSSLGAEPALSDDELVPTLTAIWMRAIFTPPAAA
jgi:TetR/AcrR family transcriptional regulator, ethionamide resistance regulator